jgi:hypothetical protein
LGKWFEVLARLNLQLLPEELFDEV